MCEEVQQPATQVPKAMVGTIVLNTIAGLVFLIPLVFVMPNQADLVALVSAQPTPVIIKSAIGSSGGTIALLIPLLVLALFCGIGCTTATSRCTWAFARDGAIPGAKWWKQVNEKLDVPLNAMMMTMVVELVLGLIYFGSSAAFNAFSGVGVICLTLSYACPIFVNLITGRKQVVDGNFYLGKLGLFCNVVSICKSASSVSTRRLLITIRLVCPRPPAFLHASRHSRSSGIHELRIGCLLRLLRCRNGVVLPLGQKELPRSAHERRCGAGSEASKRRQPSRQIES